MASYTFTIEGRPKAKGRPRATKAGHLYTPAATKKWEDEVAKAYRGPHFGDAILSADFAFWPTHVTVTISDTDATKSTLNADIDNLVKAVLDGLNGVAFDDDRQIHELAAVKLPKPRAAT